MPVKSLFFVSLHILFADFHGIDLLLSQVQPVFTQEDIIMQTDFHSLNSFPWEFRELSCLAALRRSNKPKP